MGLGLTVGQLLRLRPGQSVQAKGWITSVRRMKNVAFADVSDGSSPLPIAVVLEPSLAGDLNTGDCVAVNGTVQHSQGTQTVELAGESVEVLGKAGAEYPLQKKYHTLEYLRQHPQLRLKTRTLAQVQRYRSFALESMSSYFSSLGFQHVSTPVLTASDCEGAGETFGVSGSADFFGKNVSLSVSSQLHLEVFAAALSRVFTVTPAFRAEESDTNRHLSEFWMVEAEMAFVDSLQDLITVCQGMVQAAVPTGQQAQDLLASKYKDSLKRTLEERWEKLSGKWSTITYNEAVKLLFKSYETGKIAHKPVLGAGLRSEHEKFLASQVFNGVVAVTGYPKAIKPFYMKDDPTDSNSVACFDLLVPQLGELVGGSLREDNYELLLAKMRAQSMDLDGMKWYTDLRRFGSFPHGGYGMGFERLVMYACGIDNIRDAIGFTRGVGACAC